MNTYLHELKTYRKSAIIWALSLSAIVVLFMCMFPAFTKDVETTRQTLATFPASIRAAFDLSLQNFFNIFGFYSYILTFVVLAGAIQAMNLGTSIISKEDANKTSDFLLSKPVTRQNIMTNKLLAAISGLFITNCVFVIVSFVAASIASSDYFNPQIFLLIALIMLFVQLSFLALGTLFSVCLPRIKSVIAVSLPTVFVFYIISTLGAIFGNEKVRYITPFKFFSTDYIINNGRYEMKYLVIELVFIFITITTSYIIFAKKDIRSAT